MDPRSAALHFEAVKVSMRQSKDGVYIVLSIHPQDVPVDLMMAMSGTRYVVAMVETNDQGEPVKGKDQTEAERAVASAGMLCRNPSFQKWMVAKGYCFEASETEVSAALKEYCGIQSRADLKDNREARAQFDKLRKRFEGDAF